MVKHVIGAGTGTATDVDLYRIDLNAGDTAHHHDDRLGHHLRASARLRCRGHAAWPTQTNLASANAALSCGRTASGTYYIGISGYGNTTYNPAVAGSGTAGTAAPTSSTSSAWPRAPAV